jgi:inner membrane protein
VDNLCHTLAGAVLANAGLKKQTPRALSTLVLASNLPDIDVLVFATDTLPMAFRRGWTHGVLAQVLLPAAFAAVMYALDGIRPRATRANLKGLLLLSYVGTWLHIFMDWLNSYGVRLLMPFSERWFYGDALFIVEPLLYVVFAGALYLGRRSAKRGHEPTSWPRLGVALAAAYMLLMLASNYWARSVVRDGLLRAGRPADTVFMVTPVILNPLRREVIVDVGERYEKGFVWFAPAPHFRPAGYGVDKNRDHPEVLRAIQTPRGRGYVQWSRFPFFLVTPSAMGGARVHLNDYRYAGPGGRDTWLSTTVDLPQ